MTTDKKRLCIISGALLAALLMAFFAPAGSGRMIAAILLLPAAAVCWFAFRKRPIPSIHSKMVLLLIAVTGLLYVMLYYLSALSVGFTIAEYNWLMALVSSLIIAVVTFGICFAGLYIGKKAGTRLAGKAGIFGGAILILIGLEIFITSFL